MRSCWGFRIASSSASAEWKQANSNTAIDVIRKARNSRSAMRSLSSARAWLLDRARIALIVACALLSSIACADQQRDPELKEVIQRAISQAECFTDHYDSAVWYTLMEPRLRAIVEEHDERMEILKQVYCETHRSGETRLPPGLVMAVMDIESRFNRRAGSSAGGGGVWAGGPVLARKIAARPHESILTRANIPLGCPLPLYD